MNKYILKFDNHFIQPIFSFFWRLRNKNKDFSIISNNCWGGGIYQELKLPYLTPTIGLYFYPEDYILFLQDLKYYATEAKLTFTDLSKYKDNTKKHPYPIGLLDGKIEIHFLHYKSTEEAMQKWERRKKKINWDNLFIKMDDRDGCSIEHIQKFDNLTYNKKILFTSKPYPYKSVIYLKKCAKQSCVPDIYTQKHLWRNDFNVIKWLNN